MKRETKVSKIRTIAVAGMVALGMALGGVLNGVFGGAFGGVFGGEARAACAAAWEMGDRSVSFCGGALEDGTFTAKLEGDFEKGFTSTVILKDYKGPAFYAVGYGTGFPVNKYVVELVGLNEVTLEDSEYLYMGEMEYELTGEGRLIVKVATTGAAEGSSGGAAIEDQTKCDDFGVEDAATWIAVRVGMIGGAIAVVVAVAFGVVKLVQEIRKGQ